MVRSPTFTIESMGKSRWCLHIWPKEYTNGIHMEYYLAREEVDSGPEFITVAFELSFLDSFGIQLVKKSREGTFTRDKFKGFSDFVEQAVVYTHRRYEYLPEDTLTAFCRMRRIVEPPQKPVICFATSVIGVERSSFEWNIEKFSITRPGIKRSIQKNNPFVKIQITLTAKPEEALQFEIFHAHMDEPNLTECEISVMNASKHAYYSKKDSKYLEGNVWKFPIFLKKSQLTSEKDVCLIEDILALKCNISISLGVISSLVDSYKVTSLEEEASSGNFQSSLVTGEASLIVDCHTTENEGNCLTKELIQDLKKDAKKSSAVGKKDPEEVSEEFLREDSSSSVSEGFISNQSDEFFSLEDETASEFNDEIFSMAEIVSTSSQKSELHQFYKDKIFSDIDIIVGKEIFPAHKLILSLNSRKFKEILMNDLSKMRMELTDLDSETLRGLLDFIYTKSVGTMTWEKAQKLYLAAVRWEVTSLKHACCMFMKQNVSEHNACNVLLLAEEQKDEVVKQLALEFIFKHGEEIINTKAWDELSKKQIKLAFETMQQMYLNKA